MVHNLYDYGINVAENISARDNALNLFLTDGDQQTSQSDGFVGYGYYYPKFKKGVFKMFVPRYRRAQLNISVFDYYDQIKDSNQPFPSPQQENITKEAEEQAPSLDPLSCVIMLYLNITESIRDIKSNTYPPDYQLMHNQSIPINQTHETVDSLQSRFISQNCAFDFYSEGPIYNAAKIWYQEQYYSVVFILFISFGMISGLKFMLMINSEARVARLSLVSLTCQTIFDLALSMITMTCALNGQFVLLLCSAFSFIYAMYVDIQLLFIGYLNHLRQQGNQIGRFSFVKIMLIFYLVLFLWMFVEPFLPEWTMFMCVTLLSSYWFIQVVHNFRKDIKGRPYPLDYIILQSLVKFGPAIYFYCIHDNFTGNEVLDWYIYVMCSWFGFQFLLILAQYFLGSRFGLKSKEDKKQYDYAKQKIHPFILKDSDLPLVQTLFQEFMESKISFSQFLVNKQLVHLLPLASDQQQELCQEALKAKPQVRETYQNEEEQLLDVENAMRYAEHQVASAGEWCMNPFHAHSAFSVSNVKLGAADFTLVPQLKFANQSDCFYCASRDKLAEMIQCTICMEDLDLFAAKNLQILAIGKGTEELTLLASQQEAGQESQEIWITPCGHCFHQNCLGRWGAENLTCPTDRQPIPPMHNEVWYE